AVRLGLDRPLMPPRLMPANRRTDADTEALRSLVSRGSLVHRFNHTHPQIRRIWLDHGASQKPNRPPRLYLSVALGNPDSIPTETALARSHAGLVPRALSAAAPVVGWRRALLPATLGTESRAVPSAGDQPSRPHAGPLRPVSP